MDLGWLWFVVPILLIDIYSMFTMPKINYYYGYRNLTEDDLHIMKLSLLCMEGRDFEIFCKKLFELLGFDAELTPATNDMGKDIVLKNNDETIYVECKCYEYTPIGRPPLQKLIGSMFSDRVRKGIFITTSYYNKNALEYANKVGLELWDYNTIMDKIKEIDSTKVLEIAGIRKSDVKVKYDKKTKMRTV